MLALGLYGGRVMLVDEMSGEAKWRVQAHSREYRCAVAMSSGGRFVASVGWNDEHWKLWDAATGAALKVGVSHNGTRPCICVVGDGGPHRGENSPWPHQWRLLGAKCPAVGHIGGSRAVAFSPCARRLATGGADGAVILWDAQSGKAEHRMLGDSGEVTSVKFLVEGGMVASVGCGRICVWDAAKGALLRTIPTGFLGGVDLHFSMPPAKNVIASEVSLGYLGYGQKMIHLLDFDSGEKISDINGGGFAVFSPDGRMVATALEPGGHNNVRDVGLVDAESGTVQFTMVVQAAVCSACLSVP